MTTAAGPGVEPLRELSADVLLHPFSDDAIDEAIEKAQAHHAMHGDALKVLPFVTERIEFVLPSRVEYLDGVLNYLSEHLVRMGIVEPDSIDVVVALDEAIVNAIKHGNGYDPHKRVKVIAEISQEQATFSIEDEGMGFRIEEVPDPCAPENLLRPNGRGLLLIRNIMDEVSYNARGNSMTMVKRSETLGRRANGRASGHAGPEPETGDRQQLN
jgi:serine/threonine-protein kinase RsbW